MSDIHNIPKAYENLGFLHSPSARSIRVLCELTEPEERFRKHGIRNTIVFFGSTRTVPGHQTNQDARVFRNDSPCQNKSPQENEQSVVKTQCAPTMSRYYEEACVLASKLTEWSLAIKDPKQRFFICSGGGPGIMEATNRGATEAGGKSIGLNISLPSEQPRNSYQDPELSFEFHYFFIRKFWFFYLAKALIVFPGGFGTMDELFELLTLVQTKKSTKPMPIVIYGSQYWNEVLNFEALVDWGTIGREDAKLFRLFDDVDSAFDYLRQELTKHYLATGRTPD